MAHIEQVAELTDRQLRHCIAAMTQLLTGDKLSTQAELEARTAHCTRDELLAMLRELEGRVHALALEWRRAQEGRAA